MAIQEVETGATSWWEQFPPGAQRGLVQAGLEEFAARGFAATTTRDIARAAGLSPAGLYVHYSSKAALLHHLSRAGHEAAMAVLERVRERDLPPAERVVKVTHDFAIWHARHHLLARVVQYELKSLDAAGYAEIARLRRAVQDGLAQEVAAAVASGDADVPDIVGVTRALLSLCVDVCRWYHPTQSQTPEDIGALYGTLAERWLRR